MDNLSVLETVRELYITLTAILFNLVFLVLLESQGYRHMRSKRAFLRLTQMVAVANIASCVDVLFLVSDIDVSPVLSIISTVVVTMTNQLMALYFSIYFVRFFGRMEHKNHDIPLLSYAIPLFKVLVYGVWIMWALPHVLRTGESVNLPAVVETVAGYGFNLYHIVWAFLFFIRKRNILRRKIRYAFYTGFLLVVSTVVLQSLIGYVPHFYYLGATISLMIFYFSMESRPVSEIVTAGYEQEEDGEALSDTGPSSPENGEIPSGRRAEVLPSKKSHVKKHSIITAVFALISVLVLGSYAVVGVLLYKRSEDMFMREQRSNALDYAKTIAASVDAEAFSRLYDGCQGNDDFNNVLGTLCIFRDNSDLQYVYTTWYDENNIPVMCVDSDPVAPGDMGDALGYAEATHLALHGTPAVYDTPVTDDWGAHLSAFAPITFNGTVYGAVGVDVDYTWVEAQLRGIVVLITLTCAACFAVTIFILVMLGRYLRTKFHLLNTQINVLSYDAGGMRKIDGLRNGDEFEMIADHINEIFEQNAKLQMAEADKLRDAMAEVEKKADKKMEEARRLMQEAQTARETMTAVSGISGTAAPADMTGNMPGAGAVAAAESAAVAVTPVASAGSAAGAVTPVDAAGSTAGVTPVASAGSVAGAVTPVDAAGSTAGAAEMTGNMPGTSGTAAANAAVSADAFLPELDESVTKEEAIRRVREAAPQMLAAYRALTEALSPYFGSLEEDTAAEEDLPEIEPEELEEFYEAVREFAGIYDQDAILRLLDQLKGYAVPEADRDRLAQITELVKASDWKGLSELGF